MGLRKQSGALDKYLCVAPQPSSTPQSPLTPASTQTIETNPMPGVACISDFDDESYSSTVMSQYHNTSSVCSEDSCFSLPDTEGSAYTKLPSQSGYEGISDEGVSNM